jgi:hypothetical protein
LTKFFFDQILFRPNSFLTKLFFDQIILGSYSFRTKVFFDQIFFDQKKRRNKKLVSLGGTSVSVSPSPKLLSMEKSRSRYIEEKWQKTVKWPFSEKGGDE